MSYFRAKAGMAWAESGKIRGSRTPKIKNSETEGFINFSITHSFSSGRKAGSNLCRTLINAKKAPKRQSDQKDGVKLVESAPRSLARVWISEKRGMGRCFGVSITKEKGKQGQAEEGQKTREDIRRGQFFGCQCLATGTQHATCRRRGRFIHMRRVLSDIAETTKGNGRREDNEPEEKTFCLFRLHCFSF